MSYSSLAFSAPSSAASGSGDTDFSGEYLFVAGISQMHRLDESLRPLLESRGGRIVRLQADRLPVRTSDGWNLADMPADFFARHHFRAAFTTDNSAPRDVVPLSIPLIAMPHAFWQMPHTENLLMGQPAYLGNADYYLTQDKSVPPPVRAASLRRRDVVRLLPFGSLKVDALRERCLAETRKDVIMYCCAGDAQCRSPEERLELVRACLRRFPAYRFVLRPYPGKEAPFAPLCEALRGEDRFVFDTGASSLHWLPRAAVLLHDANTTTGQIFQVASGRAGICIAGRNMEPEERAEHRFCVETPGELAAAVTACLERNGRGEDAELTALRGRLIHRQGQARELFFRYLAAILRGKIPEEAVEIPCEYIGHCRAGTRREELELFLRRLRAGRAEFSYNLFREYGFYQSLEAFHRTLRRRTLRGLPCLVNLAAPGGVPQLGIDRDIPPAFYRWGGLRDYGPAGLRFISAHQSRAVGSPAESSHILLPDRDTGVFSRALADILLAVYGSPPDVSASC